MLTVTSLNTATPSTATTERVPARTALVGFVASERVIWPLSFLIIFPLSSSIAICIEGYNGKPTVVPDVALIKASFVGADCGVPPVDSPDDIGTLEAPQPTKINVISAMRLKLHILAKAEIRRSLSTVPLGLAYISETRLGV